MGLRKQWEDKARKEGIEQGLERGVRAGRTELLLEPLQLKFGARPDHAEERIRNASLDELDPVADARSPGRVGADPRVGDQR